MRESSDGDGQEMTSKNVPFWVTPLFQHVSSNSSSSHDINPSQSPNNNNGKESRQSQSVGVNDNLSLYRRVILDRIVTTIPYSIHNQTSNRTTNKNSVDDKEDSIGEVEVCIEDYYHQSSLFDEKKTITSDAPLFRRVAVRSYGNVSNSIGGCDSNHSGILHASFNLPLGPLPSSKETLSQQKYEELTELLSFSSSSTFGATSEEKDDDDFYNTSMMSMEDEEEDQQIKSRFQESREHEHEPKRNNAERKVKDEVEEDLQVQDHHWLCWSTMSQESSSPTKKKDGAKNDKYYLCVLTGPSTLRIFDVFPSQASSGQDDAATSSIGEGHTVALPFEASSIFALPQPYEGLIIQRAMTDDEEEENYTVDGGGGIDVVDEFAVPAHPMTSNSSPDRFFFSNQLQETQDDEYYPHKILMEGMRDMSTNHSPYHRGNQGAAFLENEDESDDDDNDNDEFLIKGPPTTVRLGMEVTTASVPTADDSLHVPKNLSPTPSSARHNLLPRRDTISSPFPQDEHNLNTGAVPVDSIPAPIPEINAEIEMYNTIPSLYTLQHPLDEVRPCIVQPRENNKNAHRQEDEQKNGKESPFRPTSSSYNASHKNYANVYEQILFVGKPRSFLPNSNTSNEDNTIVVTYNTQWKKHAIWILKHAPRPPPVEPLWKQTSRALRQNRFRANDGLGAIGTTLDINNEGGSSNVADNTIDAIVTTDEENKATSGEAATSMSSFELNALLSLTCIYSSADKLKDNKNTPEVHLGELEQPASEIFLSTAANGYGDFNVCLLQGLNTAATGNKDGGAQKNSHILRCYSLEQPSLQGTQGYWNTSNICNISCLSAQAIHSTPMSSPHFSTEFHRSEPIEEEEEHRGKLTKLKQKQKQSSFAIDVLVCRAAISEDARESKTRLSLFRGSNFIVDCAVPSRSETVGTNNTHDVCPNNALRVVGLRNAVSDRVDFICYDPLKKKRLIIVRALVSLFMKASPITESALLAIESTLSQFGSNSEKNLNDYKSLSLKLRSDCARFSQFISIDPQFQTLVNDVEWSSFSALIFLFINSALLSTKTSDPSMNNAKMECDDKYRVETFGGDNDDAWDNLLLSDFHANYQEENKNRMFIGLQEEKLQDADETFHQNIQNSLNELGPSSLQWMEEISLKEKNSNKSLFCKCIFDSLHLKYEDIKLTMISRETLSLRQLGTLLFDICILVGNEQNDEDMLMRDFIDHYLRDLGSDLFERMTDNMLKKQNSIVSDRITSFEYPPCFLSIAEYMLRGEKIEELRSIIPQYFNGECKAMRTISRLLKIVWHPMSQLEEESPSHLYRTERKLALAMVEEGIASTTDLLNQYTPGISLILVEILQKCRLDPPPPSTSKWPPSAYTLIGRSDLGQIQQSLTEDGESAEGLKTEQSVTARENEMVSGSLDNDDSEHDGLNSLERYCCMLFPNDNRVREAARLLRSSRPTFLRVHRSAEVSDHDFERLKQEKLSLLCRRTLSLPVGRGMITIGTLEPLLAEPLPMPELCLAGRIPPQNVTLAFDASNCPVDTKVWPEFHNGVAAGLRLPLSGKENGTNRRELSQSWIMYNKPPPQRNEQNEDSNGQSNTASNNAQPNHTHGGFLMALGLRGHLSALSMADICDYLTQGPVTTAVGILLGMAANKRGSCDLSVSKTLCLHIPSLLPPSFASIDVPSTTQTAAVIGVGLLYQGSSHRLMTEFLLNEIGKRPTNEQNINDREGYILCCGLALGMVNLNKSNLSGSNIDEESTGASDINIEERLLKYIKGGPDDRSPTQRGDSSERAATGSTGANNEHERCSRIYEGDMINVNITAPGATLALGLIFFQSGNKTIASQLALPDTHFLLDHVRPDFLFLRVVSRTLVLWNDVEPTKQWLEDQIPTIVSSSYAYFQKKAEKTSSLAGLATFAALTMSEVDEKEEEEEENQISEGDEEMQDETTPSQNNETTGQDDFETVDRQAIRQAYVYIVAGSCFSLGLRYAGTGNEEAKGVIYNKLLELQKLRDENDPVSLALRPERPIIEMCLGSTAIALSMVMAGTGDLDVFCLLKMLRWKCDENVKYGNHMAYGMAIGLLFLGGGTCTLGREPEDIAALLVALFPRFPIKTSDNQYHLQALRHLYALAIRNRKVEAIDIDTKEKVFVPMEVHLDDSSSIDLRTPCLLLDKGNMVKMRIDSDRYYPVEVDLAPFLKCDTNISLFVKKKSGHLSYIKDPHGLQPLHIQNGTMTMSPTTTSTRSTNPLESIQTFIEGSNLQIFADYFCSNSQSMNGRRIRITRATTMNDDDDDDGLVVGLPMTLEEFSTDILFECLTQEKLDALPLYLTFFDSVSTIEKKSWPVGIIWDLRLVRTFLEARQKKHHIDIINNNNNNNSNNSTTFSHQNLLSVKFIAMLCEHIDELFSKFGLVTDNDEHDNVVSIYSTKAVDCFGDDEIDTRWLGSLLTWYQVPPSL